jgi:hypothetical protein
MVLEIKKGIFVSSEPKTVDTFNMVFEGKPSEMPIELFDKLFVASDSSYNPMRPFRWYKFINGCSYTDNEDSLKEGRSRCMVEVLKKFNNPEKFYIWSL